jgi:phage major head subunit gpT-like protein
VATTKTSTSKEELFLWLISTAVIRELESGTAHFEDLISQYTTLENRFAGAGLTLKKEQLEDVVGGFPGGEGLNMARRWSSDVGRQAAYWPQFLVARAIREGEQAGHTTYDGRTFFHAEHYVNGVDAEDGTFANPPSRTSPGSVPTSPQSRCPTGGTRETSRFAASCTRRPCVPEWFSSRALG